MPPDAVYSFKHALVQDAAQSSLLRNARRQLHAQIAAALETDYPDIIENQPELLAHHYAEAGLPEKAAGYWLRAGKIAAARFANIEAIAHLRRGIEAVGSFPDAATKDRLELDFQFALGPCLRATQGPHSNAYAATCTRAPSFVSGSVMRLSIPTSCIGWRKLMDTGVSCPKHWTHSRLRSGSPKRPAIGRPRSTPCAEADRCCCIWDASLKGAGCSSAVSPSSICATKPKDWRLGRPVGTPV
jgi:hypothetical protein